MIDLTATRYGRSGSKFSMSQTSDWVCETLATRRPSGVMAASATLNGSVRKDEALGEEIVFELGPDDRPTRFKQPSNYYPRVR